MLTLTLPKPNTFVYPSTRYGRMNDLSRVANANRLSFMSHVHRTPFELENEHLLVGILQQLSIDPTWELEYVVEYSRFLSYSLCTPFNITTFQHVGKPVREGFYRNGTEEQWILLESERDYKKMSYMELEFLTPIIPLYSTDTQYGYKHTAEKESKSPIFPNRFAVVGLNIVDLAVGWWLYMRRTEGKGWGIGKYLSTGPLVEAQLIHNQLTLQNIVYQHLVKGAVIKSLVKADSTTFNTLDETKLRTEYLVFITNYLTQNRMIDALQVLQRFDSLYSPSRFNYIKDANSELFVQTRWVMEPRAMQLLLIYLELANRNGYSASDINSMIVRTHPTRINNYNRILNKEQRQHWTDMANQLFEMNKINMKGFK